MAKNQQPDEQKRQDLLKRTTEMAEGQNPEITVKIFKRGEHYYCAECQSELPIHRDCPTCHAHIDWDRVVIERR
jgi:hypothetical protein